MIGACGERFALYKTWKLSTLAFPFLFYFTRQNVHDKLRERSGAVVEFLTRDRKGRGFEPHRRHCVVSLSKNINPSLAGRGKIFIYRYTINL